MTDLFEEIAVFIETNSWKSFVSRKTKGALVFFPGGNLFLEIEVTIHEEEELLCINGNLPLDSPPHDAEHVKTLLDYNSPGKLSYEFEYNYELDYLKVYYHLDISEAWKRPSLTELEKIIFDLKETLNESYPQLNLETSWKRYVVDHLGDELSASWGEIEKKFSLN